jgi:ribosomal protein L33
MSGYLPAGAENDRSAPYNQKENKYCPDCGQELILEDGCYIHQWTNGCPAFCDKCGTKLEQGNYCPKCEENLF